MGFLSFKFILFLGLTIVSFFLVPKKFQWIVLLAASYLYYYLNSRYLVFVLLFESVITFVVGKVLISLNNQQKTKELSKEEKLFINKKKKTVSTIGIAIVLAILVFFKYANFIILNIDKLLNKDFDLLNLALPIGISFYSLQAISYIVDLSKNRIDGDNNIFHFLLYMSYFPQIIQGPIPRYAKLANQLFEEHEYDYERITKGLQLMLWGIAKKVIIADRIARPVIYFFNHYYEFSGLSILIGAMCYGVQVYADFSGGIDAIKGISEIFGVYLDDNFKQPFFATSIGDFWRRWHITLGAWMREYVFYPISLSKGFNRIGKRARRMFGDRAGKKIAPCITMFIVYFFVGIWHGADWKYIVYGIWNGIFLMSNIYFEDYYKIIPEKLGINKESKIWYCFSMVRTFLLTSIGRIISRSSSLNVAFYLFRSIFINPLDFSFITNELFENLGLNVRSWGLLFISVLIVLYIDYLKENGINVRDNLSNKNIIVRWATYIFLVASILVFGLYGGEYDASSFIYGRF